MNGTSGKNTVSEPKSSKSVFLRSLEQEEDMMNDSSSTDDQECEQ